MEKPKCVVCLSSVKSNLKFTVQNSFEEQLIVTFLIRKLMPTPIADGTFNKYLKSCGNPSDWITLCHICEKPVKDALECQKQIIKLITKIHDLRRRLFARNMTDEDEEAGRVIKRGRNNKVFHSVREILVSDYKTEKWRSKKTDKSLILRLIGDSINVGHNVDDDGEGDNNSQNQPNPCDSEPSLIKAERVYDNDIDEYVSDSMMQEAVDDFFNDAYGEENETAGKGLTDGEQNYETQEEGSDDGGSSSQVEASRKRNPKRKRKSKSIKTVKSIDMQPNGSEDQIDIPGAPRGTKQCPMCSKVFATGSSMRRHYKDIHAQSKSHHCQYCKLSFLLKEYLVRHIATHHPEKCSGDEAEPEEHQCEFCSKKFMFISPLLRHIKREHPEQSKMFQCEFCDKLYRQQETLRMHIKRDHSNDATVNVDPKDVARRTCPVCKRVCISVTVLNRHVREIHENIKDFSCHVCGKGFTRRTDMNRHIHNIHTKNNRKLLKCTECGKQIQGVVLLAKHMQKVHKQRQYAKCKICFKSYKQLASLHIHMVCDHGEPDNSASASLTATEKAGLVSDEGSSDQDAENTDGSAETNTALEVAP